MDGFTRFDLGVNFSIALAIKERWIIEPPSDSGATPAGANSTSVSSGISLGYFFN